MKIKRFDDLNESVKDHLKPKTSDEIRKSVLNKPLFSRYAYIVENELEDFFSDEELEEFDNESLSVHEIGKWFILPSKNKTYYAVIKNVNEIEDDNFNYTDDDFIIFNDKMEKIDHDDDVYNEIFLIINNY